MPRPDNASPSLGDLRHMYRRMIQIEARVIRGERQLDELSERLADAAKYMGGILDQFNFMVTLMADINDQLNKLPAPESQKKLEKHPSAGGRKKKRSVPSPEISVKMQ